MGKSWKQFWAGMTALLASFTNLCEATEVVTSGVKQDAIFSNEKSEAKRAKKRRKWAARQQP